MAKSPVTEDLDNILLRSNELAGAGRHEDNLALLQHALTRYPSELEVVIRAAGAHLSEAPDEAARLARAAVERAPEDPEILTRAAFVMLATDHEDETRKYFARAARLIDDDFVFAFDLVYLGGKLALKAGDKDKAEELLTIAFENQPESPGYGKDLADLLFECGEHQRALEVADKALQHRSGDQNLQDIQALCRVALFGPDALPPGYTLSREGDLP